MKKLTNFIVNKRYFVLVFFIIISIFAVFTSQKVNINYDISKYLPSTSETRKGMDIMEEKFKEIKSSSLNLMFEDLQQEKKTEIYEQLTQIKGVDSVDYDDTEEYNKDNYTLYVINVADKEDSESASEVYNEINQQFKDYKIYTSGSISDRNKSVLPISIVVLAVGCALVILTIMCESYVEPILFLISILMAVLLNKGSNIIFSSVSNITDSITAILQMALSMDYSIMLMDRYRQEKEKESNSVEAMKNALYHAFTAISSSSVTTVVGLLALVFMSFTIGRDLGLVLAKGVLFSLICIFFVLPALILMCDKLIDKTKKKAPNIKLNLLGRISYKARHISVILFIVAFVGSYLLKGNLGILYTDSQSDEVSKVFKENNQLAIIYKNEDEKKVSEYLKKLENIEGIDEVLGYGNTINEEVTAEQLNQQLSDLGSDVEIEEYLIKILYYKYYNQNEDNTMTFDEFVKFINEQVYSNEKMSKEITSQMRKDIARLENFTNASSINKKRTVSEIANILEEVDEEQIKDLLIYYNSKHNSLKLGINEFINFMNKEESISESNKGDLSTLSKFTTKKAITEQRTSAEMAKLFEMPEATINSLYTYYITVNEIEKQMSINEFSEYVLSNVLTNDQYKNMFNEETINSIKMLATFSNKNIIGQNMNSAQLSNLFGVEESTVQQLLMLKYSMVEPETLPEDLSQLQMTPYEFVTLAQKAIKDQEMLGKLQLISSIMDSSLNNLTYSYNDLGVMLGIEPSTVKNIYGLYISQNTEIKMTAQDFIAFILEHKNDELLASNLNNDTITKLQLIKSVTDGVLNNKKYSSTELSKLLGIDEEDMKLLYGLYISKYINPNQTISLNKFITFLTDDVMKNSKYLDNFTQDSSSKLNTVKEIINASLNGTKYNKEEIFAILTKLSNDVDKNMIDLLYMYFGSSNSYDSNWTLTVEKFVNYLNENIITDTRFDTFIEDDMRKDITDSKETIDDARELLIGDGYSRVVINTKLPLESEETFNLVKSVRDDLNNSNLSEVYLIGDSPMAYEMSQTFQSELDFITILTMVFIFVVVAITFKSIIIPFILVLLIQCAVYVIMGILSFSGEGVYFIALLIVQSILMGATIDYAILYTSYYLEHRKTMDAKEAVVASYNKSINTILTSASILVIVTLIVGECTSGVTSMICKTLSQGTLCSALLILFLLPMILASCDKIIMRKNISKTTTQNGKNVVK